MKKQKKLSILSDGRLYFGWRVPFFQTQSLLVHLMDSFSITTGMYSEKTYVQKKISKNNIKT